MKTDNDSTEIKTYNNKARATHSERERKSERETETQKQILTLTADSVVKRQKRQGQEERRGEAGDGRAVQKN